MHIKVVYLSEGCLFRSGHKGCIEGVALAQNGTKTCHPTARNLLFMIMQKLRSYTQ